MPVRIAVADNRGLGRWPFMALSLAMALALSSGAGQAAGFEDPEWPCVQRQVPQVSSGMVWAGPPVDELTIDWRRDSEIKLLAQSISARATEIEAAEAAVADYAETLGADRNERLTALLAASLSIINGERSSLISGIKRYDRRQGKLAERIEDLQVELNALPDDDSDDAEAERLDLLDQIEWDTRIYVEREQSLTYICEQPVLLEQRIFALGRAISTHLTK